MLKKVTDKEDQEAKVVLDEALYVFGKAGFLLTDKNVLDLLSSNGIPAQEVFKLREDMKDCCKAVFRTLNPN